MAKVEGLNCHVTSDNCNVNGFGENTYRVRTDKAGTPYIMLMGDKVDITEDNQVFKNGDGTFKLKLDNLDKFKSLMTA